MTDRNNDFQASSPSENGRASAGGKKKKLYDVSFFYSWCKDCGLCVAFCPKNIIKAGKTGTPEILEPDLCTGCRFCEKHCPDFAITVVERMPKRRMTDG